MNQAEQTLNTVKALTAGRAESSKSTAHPQAKSLSEMIRAMRQSARAEEIVWGILAAAAMIIVLVSIWV